jgi:hypothetical protein
MGAVVPGPWRPSATESEVEVLTKRIEVLERDLRRAIEIANEAVERARERADKAYQRGFRKGFDSAFEATSPASERSQHRLPFETAVDACTYAEQPDVANAKGGLLRWLRRRHGRRQGSVKLAGGSGVPGSRANPHRTLGTRTVR